MKAIDVSAGLVFRDGKLLITQRNPDSHLGLLWEFPGGKCEPDETFEECLRRELLEELGIEVEVQQEIESLTHHYPEKSVRLRFFRCALKSGEPKPLHCHNLAWIEPHQLSQYKFPAADARLLKKLTDTPDLWNDR